MTDKNIRTVVFTGGPNGGKTAVIPKARRHLESQGWSVVTISEMATMFDDSGVGPSRVINSFETALDFQREVLETQLLREKSSRVFAQKLSADNIVILCDRGLCDQIAYVGEPAFEKLLKEFGIGSINEAKTRYDAVIHMVTAADGAEEFYVNKATDPNSPRAETVEEAKALDIKTQQAWLGHAHHAIIDNSTGFDDKVNRALVALSGMLGIPEPFEIERKFIIHMPKRWQLLEAGAHEFLIRQVYLENDEPDTEERVRMTAGEGGVTYTHTIKVGHGLKRKEVEREIGYSEYMELLLRYDSDLQPIVKTRYRLLSGNQVVEIDIYPQWKRFAIMEIELHGEDDPVYVPLCADVVEEVTGGRGRYGSAYDFSNYGIARWGLPRI